MKARTLLKQLTDYGLTIKMVDGKIRLSPTRLINDRVLTFVRTHKNDLLCALSDEQQELHLKRKRNLRDGRLEVLRMMLRRFLADQKCRKMVNCRMDAEINTRAVEDYLDNELVNFDYDIEAIIATYRVYTPKPVLPRIMTCNACRHFIPDKVGDGSGIGDCTFGIQSTLELNGRMPLFRYSPRHCDKFTEKVNYESINTLKKQSRALVDALSTT